MAAFLSIKTATIDDLQTQQRQSFLQMLIEGLFILPLNNGQAELPKTKLTAQSLLGYST